MYVLVYKSIAFAKECQNSDYKFWNNVIFSDESKFNINESDGREIIENLKDRYAYLNISNN